MSTRFDVSIHAPTWGATLQSAGANDIVEVSIHAPTWGATDVKEPIKIDIKGFNPRAHVGRDFKKANLIRVQACFNPRAHVGRDKGYQDNLIRKIGFNPRAHVGRDQVRNIVLRIEEVSIHAPTWGAT